MRGNPEAKPSDFKLFAENVVRRNTRKSRGEVVGFSYETSSLPKIADLLRTACAMDSATPWVSFLPKIADLLRTACATDSATPWIYYELRSPQIFEFATASPPQIFDFTTNYVLRNSLNLLRTTFSGVSSYSFRCASGVLHTFPEFTYWWRPYWIP